MIEVHRLSTDFRAATRIVHRPLPPALPEGTVLLRRLYAGINASDVNFSAGRSAGAGAAALAKKAGYSFKVLVVCKKAAGGTCQGRLRTPWSACHDGLSPLCVYARVQSLSLNHARVPGSAGTLAAQRLRRSGCRLRPALRRWAWWRRQPPAWPSLWASPWQQ